VEQCGQARLRWDFDGVRAFPGAEGPGGSGPPAGGIGGIWSVALFYELWAVANVFYGTQ